MLILNYGSWEFWETYNPSGGTFGGQKVIFDGDNKLILVSEGETDIDVRDDIYSAWKEWIEVPSQDNAKWVQALTAIGGDPITETTNVGITFFLENGWRIKPWEGNYVLNIVGNIYTREPGQNPVIPVSGVSTSLTRSNLVDLISPESTLSEADKASIALRVWQEIISGVTTAKEMLDSINTKTTNISANVATIDTKVDDTLKKGDFIALS